MKVFQLITDYTNLKLIIMKNLLVFCLLILTGLTMKAQIPPDIEVDNYISARFEIKGIYSDGSTTLEHVTNISASTANQTLLFNHPADQTFELISFKVYTVDCSPTLTLDCTYGTDNVGDISECGRCGTGWTGEAVYSASSDYVGLRCYQ